MKHGRCKKVSSRALDGVQKWLKSLTNLMRTNAPADTKDHLLMFLACRPIFAHRQRQLFCAYTVRFERDDRREKGFFDGLKSGPSELVKTNFWFSMISRQQPVFKNSCLSGERRVLHVPPSHGSSSQCTVVEDRGANHFFRCSPVCRLAHERDQTRNLIRVDHKSSSTGSSRNERFAPLRSSVKT